MSAHGRIEWSRPGPAGCSHAGRDPDRPEGAAARPPGRWPAPGHDRRAGRRDRARAAGRRRRAELGRWFEEAADSGSLERYLETFVHTVGGDADRRRAATGSPASAPSTWPPTGSSTPRCASPRSSTWSADLTLTEVVEAVLAGFARPARSRPGPRVPRSGSATLLTAMRHAARSTEIAELAVRYRDVGVVGFDIAGAEAGLPADPAPGRVRVPAARELPLHHPRRRGVRAALDLAGAAVVRGRPARPRRTDRRRHRRRRRRAGPAGRLRAGQADPAGAVPVVQRADRRGRRRSPSTRSDCCATCGSGSPSTPTTG